MSDREIQARGEEYARLLRRFSASEIAEAYTDVMQVWEHTSWPPPGAFFSKAMENRKARAVPEHEPLNMPPPKQLDLPHERVMAILDEYPSLSEGNRQALYRLGTGGVQPPWDDVLKGRAAE